MSSASLPRSLSEVLDEDDAEEEVPQLKIGNYVRDPSNRIELEIDERN